MTFEDYMAARLPALLRFAVMLTGDRDMAQDVVQEAMARAHVKWTRICAADHPDSYIRRMITNEYLSLRRRWATRNIATASQRNLAAAAPPTADHAAQVVDRETVWAMLGGLPRRQRAVLVLRYYENLTDNEIAEVLSCRPATVRGYAKRALDTLRLTHRPAQLLENGAF